MIDLTQFRLLVVRATLHRLETAAAVAYSLAAENLLIGTALHESENLTYLAQVNGPALGLWQMEPETYKDIWENYLDYRPQMRISAMFGGVPPVSALVTDMALGCVMARIKYLRAPEPLPEANDAFGLQAYYKAVFNSPAGRATVANSLPSFQLAAQRSA